MKSLSRLYFTGLLLALGAALIGCAPPAPEVAKKEEPKMTSGMSLEAKIHRFAPTEISADVSHLSPNDRQALDKVIEAARLLDPLFRRQVWSGNDALLRKLEADT